MRVLPERHDDRGCRPARADPGSDRRSDQGCDDQYAPVGAFVPLRHVPCHRRCRAAGGDADERLRSIAIMTNDFTLSRRAFVKIGGALFVTIGVPGGLGAREAEGTPTTLDPTQLKSWLEIHEDGTIVARTGKT